MHVALVAIGEPLPLGEGLKDRRHRTGFFAEHLARHGHRVTWWTSAFDHARKRMIHADTATVRISGRLELEILRGCGYSRNVSLARIRDQRLIARQFASRIRAKERPDVILCALPPVELCAEATAYGKEFGVPVVLDMRDMWPDIFVDVFPDCARPLARLLLRPMFSQASRACSRATAITGITDPFVDWGVRRAGRARTALDRSFPIGYSRRAPSSDRIAAAEEFWDRLGIATNSARPVATFVGNLGRQCDLVHVIDAARRLHAEGHPARFVLCGNGERLDAYRAQAADLPNVLLSGWIDEAQIHVLLRRTYLALDPLPDRYDFLATINNKAIEYLSAGVPIISCPSAGLLAETLARFDCGTSYAAPEADALVSAVRDACANPSRWRRKVENARRLFDTRFAAEDIYEMFRSYLEGLVTTDANTIVLTGDAGQVRQPAQSVCNSQA
jgi:glycosyltransferase involved in cell wall biosynthesis